MPNSEMGRNDEVTVPEALIGGPDRALLRQVVVLAHAVPGAELRLVTQGGEVLTVGRHPSADLSPCQVRRALLASAVPDGPDCFAVLADLELGGALRDVGGGYCDRTDQTPERWFATCLPPADVARLAGRLDHGLPDRAMDCRVVADPELGASAVVVRPTSGDVEEHLDIVATALYSACLVEELYRQAFGAPSPSPAPVAPPGRRRFR